VKLLKEIVVFEEGFRSGMFSVDLHNETWVKLQLFVELESDKVEKYVVSADSGAFNWVFDGNSEHLAKEHFKMLSLKKVSELNGDFFGPRPSDLTESLHSL